MNSSICQKYWIPAKELEKFNQNIVTRIKIIAKFYPEKT